MARRQSSHCDEYKYSPFNFSSFERNAALEVDISSSRGKSCVKFMARGGHGLVAHGLVRRGNRGLCNHRYQKIVQNRSSLKRARWEVLRVTNTTIFDALIESSLLYNHPHDIFLKYFLRLDHFHQITSNCASTNVIRVLCAIFLAIRVYTVQY